MPRTVKSAISILALGLALAFAAKLLATALTMGSGGAGGIFAPCLVLGALTGLWYHDTLQALWPGAGLAGAESYALLGMAALVAAFGSEAALLGIRLARLDRLTPRLFEPGSRGG